MVLVKVDVFSRVWLHLKMNELDTAGDVKGLVQEALGFELSAHCLKHGSPGMMEAPVSETLLKDLGGEIVSFMLTSPTVQHLAVANELREKQDRISDENGIIPWDNGVIIRRTFISLSSHGLYGVDLVPKRKSVFRDAEPASSSATPSETFVQLQERIKALEAENDDFTASIRRNKSTLKELKTALKTAPIKVVLLFASGATVDVTTSSGKTVKQFLVQDVRNYIEGDVRLICDQQLMMNSKRLHSYNIVNDSVISIVKVVNQAPEENAEVFDPLPRVAPAEDEVEDETEEELLETPPMSDQEDECQMDEKNQMQITIRNYHTKVDMYIGSVDVQKNIGYLKEFMLQFQDISEEDKAGLVICCNRGLAFDEERTIGTTMTLMKSRTFYLRVRGLDGGALVRQHFTKEKAKEVLKGKAVKVVPENQEVEEVQFPENFKNFQKEMEEKLAEIKVLVNQGVPVFKMALRGIGDTDLKAVHSIMSKSVRGGRGEGSEQRFLQAMSYLVPALSILHNGTKSLQNLHSEFSRGLLHIFVDAYGQYADGAMKYGNSQLLSEIDAEIARRGTADTEQLSNNCTVA